MAYLKNFKRLIAAKKVLRLFATKLRLHRVLQRSSKTATTRRKIKKHPITTTSTTKGGGGTKWLSLSFQSRFKRKRKDIRRYPRKKTMPVYVDHLFLDKTKHMEIPVVAERIGGSAVEGTSGKVGNGGGVADDMWESLVMGSPQMDGINERAEEFISRFRADLLFQEITARRL